MTVINYLAETFTTFIECFILLWTYDLFFEARLSKKVHMISVIASTAGVTAMTLWFNSQKLMSFSTIYVWFTVVLLLGIALYRGNFFKVLAVCTVYMLWIFFVDFFFLTFLEFVLGLDGIILKLASQVGPGRTVYILFVKLFCLCVYFFLRRRIGNRKVALHVYSCIFITIYSAFCLSRGQSLFYAIVADDIVLMKQSTVLACWFIILGAVGLIFIMQTHGRLRRREYESRATQTQIEILEKDNRQLNNAHREIAKISHDFKSHIRTVTDLAKNGKSEELCTYLAELSEDLQNAEGVTYTGIESIDTVINRKMLQAKAANTVMTVSASYISGGIRNIDICVILSNLFDNAIEACERVTDRSKRFINCSITVVGEMTVIKIENAYDASISLTRREGDILTTKENADIHGYGLKIVRSIVEKYNGTIETAYDEKVFSVYVLLNN